MSVSGHTLPKCERLSGQKATATLLREGRYVSSGSSGGSKSASKVPLSTTGDPTTIAPALVLAATGLAGLTAGLRRRRRK